MEGRWQLMVTPDGRAPGATRGLPDEGALRHGWSHVPVVPCDDAAIGRAGLAIGELMRERGGEATMLELGTAALNAAGETP